jgi:hypothetical protein
MVFSSVVGEDGTASVVGEDGTASVVGAVAGCEGVSAKLNDVNGVDVVDPVLDVPLPKWLAATASAPTPTSAPIPTRISIGTIRNSG